MGVIIGLIIYNAFEGALDCTTLTGYDSSTPASSTDQAKACIDTKANASIVFGIIPVFIKSNSYKLLAWNSGIDSVDTRCVIKGSIIAKCDTMQRGVTPMIDKLR